jgi:starch synthase
VNILHLAADAAPLWDRGDADEAAGALAAGGHDVRVALPFSRAVDRARWKPAPAARVNVPRIGGDQIARIDVVRHAGVLYYLIAGPPVTRARRSPPATGDIAEDGPPSVFTALAALGLCRALSWAPDVVHGYGGPSGAAIAWLAAEGLRDPLLRQTATVFTVHSLVEKHRGAGRALLQYGLAPSDSPVLPDWARDSLLGLGLAHADLIGTSNPALMGKGARSAPGSLAAVLAARRDRVVVIPHGLDLEVWDPAHDPHLAACYDVDQLDRRALNKRALQEALGLAPLPRAPLLALLPPRAPSPGLETVLPALRALLAREPEVQLAAAAWPYGSSEALRALAREFAGRVRLGSAGDVWPGRRFLAAADLVLALSPLAALTALRYGAVPLAHAAGDLASIVTDTAVARNGTGFCYSDYNSSALLAALERALRAYRQPARWRALQRRGMRRALRFSWARSATAYLALYQQAMTFRKETVTRLLAPAEASPDVLSARARPARASQR